MPIWRNRKVGLEAVGIDGAARVHWSLGIQRPCTRKPSSASRGHHCHRGPAGVQHGPAHRPLAQRPVHRQGSRRARRMSRGARSTAPIDAAAFDGLEQRMLAYLRGKELFVQDCWAGADPGVPAADPNHHRESLAQPVRAAHVHSRGAIPRARASRSAVHRDRRAELHGRSGADRRTPRSFILLNFAKRRVLIGGTNYAGEIKKSIFTVMNYLLPLRDVMPMHCSANVGRGRRRRALLRALGHGQDDALERPDRQLIGDDEHGWSADGVFNFEGGCYAKMIRLSAEAEPQIYATTHRFGTVLENVAMRSGHAQARSERRLAHREHARRVSADVHRQRGAVRPGRASDERRDADGRRVRRAAADRAAVAGGGDVPLPLGLHGEGRGHRARRDRAEGDVQHVLRRAVHGVGSERLRQAAGRAHREAQVARVAGEHGLDGRRRTASARA